MKVAIIGKGRTGGALLSLLDKDQIVGPFGRSNPATLDALNAADVVICFVPAEAMDELTPLLLEARLPVVWGVTGYQWPETLSNQLKDAGLTWVKGHNFSLIMPIIKRALNALGLIKALDPNSQFAIHEVHHTGKLDAPSGTALSWGDWLVDGQNSVKLGDITITSDRVGEVVGDHQLTISNGDETISLQHQAHDRRLFARGALWAAQQLVTACQANTASQGLIDFHTLIDDHLKQQA